MMSLELTPGANRPSTRTSYVFGSALEQGLGGEDHLDLARADPECECAERPVRRVCESPQTIVMPGWVSPICGPMTWTIPCEGEPIPWSGTPNSRAVPFELADLGGGRQVEHREVARRRRDGVVGGRDGLGRSADREAALAEPREGLRRGHLVDEVEVDGQDGRGAGVLADNVVVPDLVDDRARRAAVTGWLEVMVRVALHSGFRRSAPAYQRHRRWVGGTAP